MRTDQVAEDRSSAVAGKLTRGGGNELSHSYFEASEMHDLSSARELQVEECDVSGSLSLSKQLSMRRSRTSSELDRDPGCSSPSATPRNVTPLTSLTPLKWKPSKREEDAGKGSNQGMSGEIIRDNEELSGSEEVTTHVLDEHVREQQRCMEPSSGQGVDCQTKSSDESSLTKGQQGTEPSSDIEFPSLERKPSLGEDSSTMTIDFLRARLLSERASSKAAKHHVQLLEKKVIELEHKLEHAIELRKKAEAAAGEAISKLKSAGLSTEGAIDIGKNTRIASQTRDPAFGVTAEATPPETRRELVASRSRTGLDQGKEDSGQDGASCEGSQRLSSNGELSRGKDNSSPLHQPLAVSGANREEGVVKSGATDSHLELDSISETPNRLIQRAATEERLRNMWNQISEEMVALAEDRSQEELIRKELMSWMGQVPAVLQDILPKDTGTTGEKKQVGGKNPDLSRENSGVQDVSPQLVDEQTEAGVSKGDVGNDREDENSSVKMIENFENKGSELYDDAKEAQRIERYKAEEIVQLEWEQNYYAQQKLEQFKDESGNNGKKEAGAVCTSGDMGTPLLGSRHLSLSSLDKQQIDQEEGPLASVQTKMVKSKSTTDFSPRVGNGKVDLHAPHFDALYADSETIATDGERFYGQVLGGKTNDAIYSNKEVVRQQRQAGVARSPVPVYMTTGAFRMQQEHSVIATRASEAEGQVWAERRIEQDPYSLNHGQERRGALEREGVHRSQGHPGIRSSNDIGSGLLDYSGRSPRWDASGDGSGWVHQQMYEERGAHCPTGRPENQKFHRQREGMSGSLPPDAVYGSHGWHNEDYGIGSRPPEGVQGVQRQLGYAAGHLGPMRSEPPQSGVENYEMRGSLEVLQYRERHNKFDRDIVHRRDTQASLQANQKSRSHYYTENQGGWSDMNGYLRRDLPFTPGYPAWAPQMKDAPVSQPSMDAAKSKVNEVLRALQIAKQNIQRTGSEESPFTTTMKERHGGDQPPGNGGDPPVRYRALPLDGHQKEQTKLSEAYVSGRALNPARNSSPLDNERSSYVEKMSVGTGIQFFF